LAIDDLYPWAAFVDKLLSHRTIMQLFSAVARIDGLGRATVLPQLNVKRLCAAVGAAADFDPKRMSGSI
jgi:hypothetical protein